MKEKERKEIEIEIYPIEKSFGELLRFRRTLNAYFSRLKEETTKK